MRGRAWALVACFSLAHAPVGATPPADPALAEHLFVQGKEALEAGRVEEACRLLADSHALDPGGGTILALAGCWERLGRLASAWAAYGEALAFAQRDGRGDREDRARTAQAALVPRLAWLRIDVPHPVAGLRVERDGVPVPPSVWGTRVPSDEGVRVVRATAPGHQAWSTQRVLRGEQAVALVVVPRLVPAPTPPAGRGGAPAVGVGAPAHDDTAWRITGYTLLGLGAVGVGVGGALGLHALDRARDADRRCPTTDCADARAVAWSGDATRAAGAATLAVGLGAAAVLAGGTVLLSLPTAAEGRAGTGAFGAAWRRSW